MSGFTSMVLILSLSLAVTVSLRLSESGAREEGRKDMKQKAIEAFKENCQRPKDTEPCECKLCVRWVGGHCELLDGFIEKLNS